MKLVDGNNMLHREAEKIGRGIHPVRFIYSKFISPPETTIIVWDGPYANKRRQAIFPEYKANRRPKEESKFEFFDIAKGVLRFAPIIQVECPGWEADDVIGTLIDRYHHNHNITVETNDGDYWQHSNRCHLPLVSRKWKGMGPDECLLHKVLVGDRKDGLPGIQGFGIKSWDYLTPRDKEELVESLVTGDYLKFQGIKTWPPKIKVNQELFKKACLYWKLKKYWSVPFEEIDAVTFSGTLNIDAAEIFMGKFLI